MLESSLVTFIVISHGTTAIAHFHFSSLSVWIIFQTCRDLQITDVFCTAVLMKLAKKDRMYLILFLVHFREGGLPDRLGQWV